MRIVHTEASLGWGGQEIRILGEAAGMIARGHTVHLLCPAEAQIFAEAPSRGVPVVALPIGRKRLPGMFALRAWLKANPTDLINTHSSTDSWLAALACASMANAPAVVRTRHISTTVPDNATTRWLYTKGTAHIVTTGERLREQLMRDNGFAANTLTSVPTGIDLSRFVPADRGAARTVLGLPMDATIIGIVATLRDWKGHVYLLEAFARLLADKVAPNLQLVIVGDGPQRANLQRMINAAGLEARVTMCGNQQQVAPWMQAFDIFCLPSYANEGVPQALMQAMACGLPVISTPVGSISEIIDNGNTGIIVEARNTDALCAAIARLIADPALRARLGHAARAAAEARFSDSIMLDRMEKIFRDAVAAR